MLKTFFKKALPHIVAVIVFLVVALLYSSPALDNKVLQQSDVTFFNGAIQNSVEYSKTHDGKYPLWTNGMFCGMPSYQIGGMGGSVVLSYAHQLFTLNLPQPVQFFFLASLCFYIMCCCFGINPWVGIIGGLSYAYATYNPIIIGVGHNTKMWAIGYMPAVLGSIYLILQKKYWIGFALTTLFSGLIILMNHLQISYYLYLAIGIMCLAYAIKFIFDKDFKALLISPVLIAVAIAIGVAGSSKLLFSTYEYQKQTQRGGASALADTIDTKNSKTGLNKDYAFSYSMFKTEPLVLMFPRAFGGSSSEMEVDESESEAIAAFVGLPKELQKQLPPPSFYWGGIGGTSGPPYASAVICCLAIIGMFVVQGKHKWWMLTAFAITLMMSWGSYFDGFNTFLYNNLPFYNKFRAPSMILVVPQLILSLMAVLTLHEVFTNKDESKKEITKKIIFGCIATAGVFLFTLLCYSFLDFKSDSDKNLMKQILDMNNPQLIEMVKNYSKALVNDRKGLFMGDIGRSFLFCIATIGILFASTKLKIKPIFWSIPITLLLLLDLMPINNIYLNADNYMAKEDNESILSLNAKDNEILRDKSDYRVLNVSGNAFSESYTSFGYKSIGGYHSAKLRIYQDLIEKQFSKQPNAAIINMLNVKYFIQKNGAGQTENYQANPNAIGSAWFVNKVSFVKNAKEEMAALDFLTTAKDTAFVQSQFKNSIPFEIEKDTTSKISLVKNENDYIEYAASNTKNQLAVFSEIYYDAGWKAFVDGKEQSIIKVDYVLRGLALAPGQHKVEFKFEPEGYLKGVKILSFANIAYLLILLSLLGYLYLEFKKNKKISWQKLA